MISRTGRLLLIAASITGLVATGSLLGWWGFLTGTKADPLWNWVERISWVSAFLALILTLWYERRARLAQKPPLPEPEPESEPLNKAAPVNHDPERIRLEEELAARRSGVILVHGPAGVGKTTLVNWVIARSEEGPELQKYDLVAGDVFDTSELVQILHTATEPPAMGLRPKPLPLQEMEVALEDETDPAVVIVVDGAQRLLEPETDRFVDLHLNEALAVIAAHRSRRVKVILISDRIPVAAGSATWTRDTAVDIPVSRLSEPYFRSYLEILDPTDSLELWDRSDDLCDILQGLPRNANLFSAALTIPDAGRSAKELSRLLGRTDEQDRSRTLAQLVVKSLSSQHRSLVAAVAAYDMPVTSGDVATLLGKGLSPGRVEDLLGELAGYHVIIRLRHSAGYRVMDPEIITALERSSGRLNELRHDAALLLYQKRKQPAQIHGPKDLDILFTELRITLSAEDWLEASDRIKTIDTHLIRWGASGLLMESRQQVAEKLHDPLEELRNYNALGYASTSRGDHKRARRAYRKALVLTEGLGRAVEDRRKIVLNMADLEWQEGKTTTAKGLYEDALHSAEQESDDPDRLRALSGLADCLRRHGDHGPAIRHGRTALSLATVMGLPVEQVDLAVKISRWLSEQNESRQAWTVMEDARLVAERYADRSLDARILDGEADLYLDQGDFATSRLHAVEALRKALVIHDPVTVLQARTTLAMAALRDNRPDEARAEIDRASWYRRENRSLIVLALQALIAFRQAPDGHAREHFKKLEQETAERCEHDPLDFAAWDLHAIAICGLGVDRDGQAARAMQAFARARAISSDFPVLKERLRYMLGIVAAGSASYPALRAAAGVDQRSQPRS